MVTFAVCILFGCRSFRHETYFRLINDQSRAGEYTHTDCLKINNLVTKVLKPVGRLLKLNPFEIRNSNESKVA